MWQYTLDRSLFILICSIPASAWNSDSYLNCGTYFLEPCLANTKKHLSIDIFSIRWGWIINWNKCLNLIVRFSGMKSIRSFERTVTVMKFISMKLDLQLANSLSQFHGFRNSFVYLIALLWYFFVWNIWGIYVFSIEFSSQIENEFRQCRIGSPKLEQVSTSELLT